MTPRLALQRKEAAEALGVSGDTFDRHIRPQLRCVYVGDLRLWPTTEIESWLERSAVASPEIENAPATLKRPGARHRRT